MILVPTKCHNESTENLKLERPRQFNTVYIAVGYKKLYLYGSSSFLSDVLQLGAPDEVVEGLQGVVAPDEVLPGPEETHRLRGRSGPGT